MSGDQGNWGVVLVLLALSACTATKAVSPVDSAEPTELRLKAGDSIRVVTKQRERMSFEITAIRASEMAGVTVKPASHETLPLGQDVVVHYADIALVEVRRFSALRTAAVPVLVVLMAGSIALGATPVIVAP